jgi:hypothetical protein
MDHHGTHIAQDVFAWGSIAFSRVSLSPSRGRQAEPRGLSNSAQGRFSICFLKLERFAFAGKRTKSQEETPPQYSLCIFIQFC